MGIASKRGRTLKLEQFASLYIGSGWTNNHLTLVVIFNKIFSISNCSGQDIIKYPACSNTWPLYATKTIMLFKGTDGGDFSEAHSDTVVF